MLDKEQILWFCKEKESPKHKKERPEGRSLMTRRVICPSLSVRPARTYSNGCKSPSRPDSGKATAESKGVHCEVESEGSFRQTSDPTYRNLISRLMRVDKSAEQDKVP